MLLAASTLAILAGALPLHSGRTEPVEAALTVFVMTNGFHTDIVLPTVGAGKDWRPLLATSPITRQSLDAPWMAFGWGSQAAYTQLGTFADLSAGLMLKAIAFDRSVVHLQPLVAIRAGDGIRRFALSEDGYRALVAHVESSLQTGEAGGPVACPISRMAPAMLSCAGATDSGSCAVAMSGSARRCARPVCRSGSGRRSRNRSCGRSAPVMCRRADQDLPSGRHDFCPAD